MQSGVKVEGASEVKRAFDKVATNVSDLQEGHQKEADKGDTEDPRDDGSGVNPARSDPEKLRKAARAGCEGVARRCWPIHSGSGGAEDKDHHL